MGLNAVSPAKDTATLEVRLLDKATKKPVDAYVEVWARTDERTKEGKVTLLGQTRGKAITGDGKAGWEVWVRDRPAGTTVAENDKRKILGHSLVAFPDKSEFPLADGKVVETIEIDVPAKGAVTGRLVYKRTWKYEEDGWLDPGTTELVPGVTLELWARTTAEEQLGLLGTATTDDAGAFTFPLIIPELLEAQLKIILEGPAAVFVSALEAYKAEAQPKFNPYTEDWATYEQDVSKDKDVDLKRKDKKVVITIKDPKVLKPSLFMGPLGSKLGDVRVEPTRARRLCDAFSSLSIARARLRELSGESLAPCAVEYPRMWTAGSGDGLWLSDDCLHSRCMVMHEYGHYVAGVAAKPAFHAGYDYRSRDHADYFTLPDKTMQGHTGNGRCHYPTAYQEAIATFFSCVFRKNTTYYQYWVGAKRISKKTKKLETLDPVPLKYEATKHDPKKLGAHNEQSVLFALWKTFGPGPDLKAADFKLFWGAFTKLPVPQDIGDFLVALRQANPAAGQRLEDALVEAGSPFLWRFDWTTSWKAVKSGFGAEAREFSSVDDHWKPLPKGGPPLEDLREMLWNCNSSVALRGLEKPALKDGERFKKGTDWVDPKVVVGMSYTVPRAVPIKDVK